MKKVDESINKEEEKETTIPIDKPVIKDKDQPEDKKEIYHRTEIFNSVLSFFNKYLKYVDVRKLWLYQLIHTLFITAIGIIVLFDCNLVHLMMLLIIVSLDAISVVILEECPLSILERRHTGNCLCDERYKKLKDSWISYDCNHEYEKQIELLINVWVLISGKCLTIIILTLMNIKLVNYNNIYLS
jgi:hypothetical protein